MGWKLGLERMRLLSTTLGLPQHRFASIHVVGTNGKSSVTRMVAALLEAHGVSAGACVSPHQARWSERILLHGEEIGEEAFEAAVERAARGAEAVNRGLGGDEEVTQFEVATAAAFAAFAAVGVDAAVIEAGLGGRLDATNTIPSKITVLTSIGLDHTEWLGESELEIAVEKLAVLRDHTTLVLGKVDPDVRALAERTASERGARVVIAPEDPGGEVELRAAGRFQRRNFALARAAAEAFLGRLDPDAVVAVAASLTIPGRLERIADDPPIYLDAAHNPDGATALAEALPEIAGGRPVVACVAILADKDARAMLAALAPAVNRFVCSQLPADGSQSGGMDRSEARRRWFGAEELAEAAPDAKAAPGAGIEAEAIEDFDAALARGRVLARDAGGTLLVAGSHYVLEPARKALGLWQD